MSDPADKTTKVPFNVDLSNAKVEVPLATTQQLMTVEEHGGLLRDAVEIDYGWECSEGRDDPRSMPLLVRAYDERPQV
jgi:hypothetical protein